MADSGVADRWHKSHPKPGEQPCPDHKGLVPTADHGRGLRWLARYRTLDGRQCKESFGRKVDAEGRLVEVLGDQRRGVYVDVSGGKRKLRAYALEWLAAQTTDPASRERTESRVRLHVLPVLGDAELRAIRPSTVQAWLRGLQERLAANYVRVVFAHFTAIMSAAVDDGLIARSPCQAASVKPPARERRRVVPWTGERVAMVTAALPERYRVVGVEASGLGLRIGECFGLAVDDIDFLRHVVHVRRQVRIVGRRLVFGPPKGGKERDVPLPEQVGLRLAAHLQSYPGVAVTLPWREPAGRPETARLVITTPTGGALDRAVFNKKAWGPARKEAGVPAARENGAHALRHYFASVLLENGVSIKALAEYLGHSDAGFTLAVYTHLMPSSEARMRDAVDAALSACAPVVTLEASNAP